MSLFSEKTIAFRPHCSEYIVVFLLALTSVFISFIWQGNIGFSLSDEGYLWYGVQRVLLGEVPLRDFMSYDIGRYYWSAGIMNLFGVRGIMALRFSVAIFQTFGLVVGLILIARNNKRHDWAYLFLAAATLMLWMYPRQKLFDISISIFLLGTLTALITRPTRLRYLLTGICIGMTAVFGRNHGMYGAFASFAVMAWLSIKQEERRFLASKISLWVAGVCLGFSPTFIISILKPGFVLAFWDSIRFLFEIKSTNLPLPVPWPWKVNFSSPLLGDTVRQFLIGSFFFTLLAFALIATCIVISQRFRRKKTIPTLAASAFLSIPYAHVAFARADVSHLAQGIFPFLIGCMIFLANQRPGLKWGASVLVSAASLWIMHVYHPGWQHYQGKKNVNIEISGNELLVTSNTAKTVTFIRKLSMEYTPNNQPFVVLPFTPGAYALLERKSPMWEIYALFPRSKKFQQDEISRIQAAKPGFVLIYESTLDGREDLRFRNTHPLIYQYIVSHFNLVPRLSTANHRVFTAL